MVRFQRVKPDTGQVSGRVLTVLDPSVVAYVTASDRHEGVSLITFVDEKTFYVKGTDIEVAEALGVTPSAEESAAEAEAVQIEASHD